MSKANIIRTAFNTIIEASILESRKEQEKGLTAAQKRAKRDAETGVGQRAPAYRDFVHKRTRGAGNPYRPASEYLRRLSPVSNVTRGELYNDDKDKIKKSLAGHLARTATSPEVRKRAGEKLMAKENIMNYRQSLRALFEAVIDHTIETIEESSAARKAAVRAKLAAAGYKQSRSYKTQVKPQFKDQPYSTIPSTGKMARRVPKKVRGQLDPHDEQGRISLDGKREYVYDKAAELPYNSKAGKMARGMKSDYKKADEEERREQAAHDAEWEEDDRELSNFFRGGRSRGMFK